jgi:hypothetical protein
MGSSTPEEALLAGRHDLESGVGPQTAFAAQYKGALVQLNILGDGSCILNQVRAVAVLSLRPAVPPAPPAAARCRCTIPSSCEGLINPYSLRRPAIGGGEAGILPRRPDWPLPVGRRQPAHIGA